MSKRISRREFIRKSAAGGTALAIAMPALADTASANEKLNVAVVGVAGRGAGNLGGVSIYDSL